MCTWMYLCREASYFWQNFPDLRIRSQLRRMRVSDAAAIAEINAVKSAN